MKNKNILSWVLIGILLAIGIVFSIVSFGALAHFFGTLYAVKTFIKTFIIIAIVEVVICFIERKIKKKKNDKEGD